jgi:hypothetical protein
LKRLRVASPGARALGAVAVAVGGLPAGLALVAVDHPVWRALAALFLLTAPAVTTMALLPNLSAVGRLVCGIAGAVVLNGLVAEGMLALGIWSIPGGATAVSIITAGLLVLAASAKRPASESGPPRGDPGPPCPREAGLAS